ncbi:unnamed protein product [Trifolium pratense]|uniref:Uncharacterized protein n=1 Tax=Trifolium pratense TaxID=57577 RepID=A0ACB0LA43_TRIPR|nr:unnamed protein product [Trifolium pratense]
MVKQPQTLHLKDYANLAHVEILLGIEILDVQKFKKNWFRLSFVLVEDFTFRRIPELLLTHCSRGVRIGVGVEGSVSKRIEE